jgi:DNA-directed RNA polymerase specialized sigma24 family protein
MPPVISLSGYRTGPARLLMLVRRTASDDRAAFTRLYEALAAGVSATVRDAVDDPVLVDTITSDTFVEVWRSACSHTAPGTDVAAWVTSIATRRAGHRHADDGPGHADDGPGHADDGPGHADDGPGRPAGAAMTVAALLEYRPRGRHPGGGRPRG